MTVGSVLFAGRETPVGKVLCVGRNYAAHAGEMGEEVPKEPFFFLKPRSAVVRPDGGDLFIPAAHGLLHHEVELAVLLGARGSIAGYGVALDLTLRERQAEAKRAGLPWTMAKGFDGSAPVGAFVPAADAKNVLDQPIRLTVGGEVRQEARTSSLVFSPAELLRFASRFMTVEEGDLLFTGTPEGVGPLVHGDRVAAAIGGLPELGLRVRRE